ncbi:cytochrome C biogenesis protein CcdA [Paenibacillus sp. J31TS4]|uniref:cytochrome c biogenesis CcdA family protein n=1 Tax=Paenibacillus sp. J31TS4 TaxID=2807195 RepID=UPI001B0BB7FE|nr:cytochrome c biogenesis protein CcdA [Paenibacillus sp. J31TS4]GIP40824.1 cytochrome C biogenesis protein CcdA [Paenibacillus sp. J31TS4]
MEQITVLVAFAAGLLSFLSPCVFPLVPAYVSHITGAIVEGGRVAAGRRLLLVRSAGFILGFSLIFVAMGASASVLGQFFAMQRDLIEKLGGLLIIVFGLQMAGVLRLKWLMGTKSWGETKRGGGWWSSVLLGLAFGTGWTPCVGLALSSILILAGSSESLYQGMGLLSVFSLGLGIPFLLISVAITYSLSLVKRINRFLPVLGVVNGWLMVALGLLLYTGQMQKMSAWLARYSLFNF